MSGALNETKSLDVGTQTNGHSVLAKCS